MVRIAACEMTPIDPLQPFIKFLLYEGPESAICALMSQSAETPTSHKRSTHATTQEGRFTRRRSRVA